MVFSARMRLWGNLIDRIILLDERRPGGKECDCSGASAQRMRGPHSDVDFHGVRSGICYTKLGCICFVIENCLI
jgi:hypothetical protein